METLVSIIRCGSYADDEVVESLRQAIDLIGGIAAFVKRGDRVLLKPNLLYGKPPEKAVTTHPSIIRGMIQIVRDAGGRPIIGDSPSIGSVMRAADKAGIMKVADEVGCPVVEFNQPVPLPGNRSKCFKHVEVDRTILESDVMINLPKWKTHAQMLLTLGVKNLFGCIPGPRKAMWHLKAGENRELFAQMLVDLYCLIPPSLTILDGILAMEGDGPGSGKPVPLGLILASRDALGVDQIVCDLIGVSRNFLPTNRVAFRAGLGCSGIHAVGEPIDQVKVRRFELPSLTDPAWNLPGFVKWALKNAWSSRPVVREQGCQACGRCEEICPPKALTRGEKGLVFDYKKCIRCFCCLEVCPEGAIAIEPGWASRLVRRMARGTRGKILNDQ